MRLQSAIFTLGDTLFTPDGAAREGLHFLRWRACGSAR